MAEAPDKPLMTPAEALKKYDYKGAEEDQKAINKVESAIATHFPASFETGLAARSKDAPIKEDEVHGKMDKAKQDAGEAAANDKDAQKELKQDPGAKNPPAGVVVKPSIQPSHPQKTSAVQPKKGKGEDAAHAGGGKAGGKGGAAGGHDVGSAPSATVLQAATSGDKDIDKFLDGYERKSSEPTERLSKIKEMASVAKGFDGQLDKYVDGSGKIDSASAKVTNFLGKKEMGAAFGANPYDKVQDGLGTIMKGLSRFGNIVSVVGNVCTKIGLVLTLAGLLGMILPPIGAAVSAVARVLNVVGIICDVIGVAIGGILTGLNGVVLAKQIAKGASNEEKAATADMMVSEATSAGGHVLSLAMSYGPRFMKGFKGASKNLIGNLFSKFKSVVGKFAGKTLGPVANWAKNIGYKLGIGLEKKAGPGLISKAWNSPGTALEKIRDLKYIKKFNNSAFSQGAKRFAGKVGNSGFVKKVEGYGENAGESAGTAATSIKIDTKHISIDSSTWSKSLVDSAETDAKVIAVNIERNAGQNAANRERAAIDQSITNHREMGNNEYVDHRGDNGVVPERNVRRSDAAYKRADELKASRTESIANAEKTEGEGAKDTFKEHRDQHERNEHHEEARVDEFNKDPKKFQANTANAERRLGDTEKRLEDPNLAAEEKEKLEHTAKRLEKSIADRKMIPMIANGGESPETLLGAFTQGKEIFDTAKGIAKNRGDFGWKDEKSERAEKATKRVEGKSGHEAHEADEKAERREKIGEFEAENFEHSEVGEHVDGMLQGLDEELGFEAGGDEDSGHEGGGDDSALADLPGGASNEGALASAGQKTAEPAAVANEPVAAVPAPAPSAEPAHEEAKEKAPDPGVLAYWPALTKQFADGVTQLHRMRVVAYEFKKQQFAARKKAHEAAVTFNRAGDSAALQADLAKQQAVKIGPSLDEAKTSGAQAAAGGAQADKGASEQSKGSGASNTPTARADAGEKPSRWHPIKRIWWYVKQWASEKAAQVFGWIQNQIASLVLEGLCGVSMGDMKAYTEALRRRMEFSKVSGTQGVEAAKSAVADSGKTVGESKSYEQQALADAAECDQNMADADAFSNAVEGTEHELVQEQAKAREFLDSLRNAVTAERQQQEAEKAKKAQESKVAKAATGGGGSATSAPVTASVPKPKAAEPKSKQPKPVSVAAIGKVQNAAGYVAGRASVMLQMFTDLKNRENSKLQQTLAKKGEFVAAQYKNLSVGDALVSGFGHQTTSVAASMGHVKITSAASADVLRGNASEVKSKAKELDEISHHTHEKLNEAFKSTYDQINAKAA